MSTSNTTHRKKLARAIAAQTGESYAAALTRVVDASEAGRLPSRLDEAGRAAALRILTTEPGDAQQSTSAPGPDHRTIPELSSAELADALAGVPTPRQDWNADGDWEPRHQRASDPLDQRVWDLSYAYEKLTGRQGLVYISAPGGGADKYVFGGHHDVAGKGSVALGRAEALGHITQKLYLARAEIQTRMSSIVATYGNGGVVELPAPCRECGGPGRYTIDGVTLCTRHRGLLGKFQGLPVDPHAGKVTLVDMDATWPPEVHDEYVGLLLRLNAAQAI